MNDVDVVLPTLTKNICKDYLAPTSYMGITALVWPR